MSRAHPSCRGSILFVLFASVAMVGIVGVAAMNLMRGPVRAMADVTHRTLAENQMMASGKLALIVSAKVNGDCDADGIIEPLGWRDAGGLPIPANGGLLPTAIGAALTDPWGRAYGYCAWDHGSVGGSVDCGGASHRLRGGATPERSVLAIISAGPNQSFETTCLASGAGEYIQRGVGSDDLVLAYDFAQALSESGGLWTLEPLDATTATIDKNLSVTDEDGTRQLSFDAASAQLALGDGGTGSLPNIKTDFIQNLTANAPVEFLSDVRLGGDMNVTGDIEADGALRAGTATIQTAQASAVAAIVTSSGSGGIGLKASGAAKAIEAEGLLDMTGNRIVNLDEPIEDDDAASKKYVDDRFLIAGGIAQRCDGFMPSACTGGPAQNLTKTSLGACKAACQAANMQCCEAVFPAFSNNPNAPLSACRGYAAPSQPGSLTGLLAGLFGTVAAFCYRQ